MKILRPGILLFAALGLLYGCAFDATLRAYLDVHFWLPFAKHGAGFERRGVRRVNVAFAGMTKTPGRSSLAKLRAAYQAIPQPQIYQAGLPPFDPAEARQALAAARADSSLTASDREEVDLIDAKIDMRSGTLAEPDPLRSAKRKLEQFLRTARTPALLSEARGWLARVDYLLGDHTAAGKIYLDELNRDGSNLSRETLLTSLQMNYGYDGGPDLSKHLDEYFDTPEHAAFAIQLVTNPHWPDYDYIGYERQGFRSSGAPPAPAADAVAKIYARIQSLLEAHRDLLAKESGSSSLTLLTMRTALHMGDPPGALKIAEMTPPGSAVRSEPDFLWMLASSEFLSHNYAAAEKPLLDLFQSKAASSDQKAAAAYGLVGVYRELNNPVEGLHYALNSPSPSADGYYAYPSGGNEDISVYWAYSGWDLDLLLDSEAPIEALSAFIHKYPTIPKLRLVKYSLAVRLARENRYEESAQIYQSTGVLTRAARMRGLADLYKESTRTDLAQPQLLEAKFKLAQYIAGNEDRLYFNDQLWHGVQRYALYADSDSRLDQAQHQAAVDGERLLKDSQEERWRAYLILKDVVHDAGKTELGRRAAQLGIDCLRKINQDRFGREADIHAADAALTLSLRQR